MKLNNMNLKNKNSHFFIPYNVKTLIIYSSKNKNKTVKSEKKYKKIILLSEFKKFIFITKNDISFQKWSNSLLINKNTFLKNQNKINKNINNFFYLWNLYFFKKIKFKGKGFRIKFLKKNKLIKFYFGKSHKTFFFLKKIKKKKISKYKFIIYGLNYQNILKNAKKITNIKKINFYTLRGLRLSRQKICKRKGKKGTYI